MKKIITLMTIIAPLLIFGQLSQDQNYTHTVQYTTETQDGVVNSTGGVIGNNDKIESINYIDGIGRAKQSIVLRQGGNSESIVKHYEYDAVGRQAKSYMPFVLDGATTNHQALVADPVNKINTFYNTTKYENTTNPYSETVFEKSPLSRPIEQAAPGAQWSLTSNHTIKASYGLNTVDDAIYDFDVVFQGNNVADPTLIYKGYYRANKLYKTGVKNENNGSAEEHYAYEFTDQNGNVVLKRIYLQENGSFSKIDTYYVYDDYGNLTYVLSPEAVDQIFTIPPYQDFTQTLDTPNLLGQFLLNTNASVTITLVGNQLTLDFSYTPYKRENYPLLTGQIAALPYLLPDSFIGTLGVMGSQTTGGYGYEFSIENGHLVITGAGNLGAQRIGEQYTITLPNPNVTIDAAVIDGLAYQYKYDHRNRMIERKVPGAGWESIVYDKLDRPVLTQDTKLANLGKWLFTKYDKFNRPVYSGMYTNASSRSALQSVLDTQTVFNEEKTVASIIDNTTIYYTNNSYPTSNITLLNISYFDDYNFNTNSTVPNTVQTFGQVVTTNTKGLTIGTKERILDTNQWIHTVIYYDEDVQPIYTSAVNEYLGTTDTVGILYNFTGNVLKTEHKHSIVQAGGTQQIVTLDYFTYDHQLRMLTHKQEIKNGAGATLHALELLAKNTYDELGKVTKVLVGNTEASPLQEVNYAYTIRGWLKSINNPEASLTNDVFALALNYTNNMVLNTAPKYDGSINSSVYRTASDDKKRGYGYVYDNLGRLKSATYKAGNSFTEELNFYDLKNVSYDKNGNITQLERNAPNATFTAALQIDNLNYDYHSKTNQLEKVTDLANNIRGFTNGASANNTDYDYDVNGNVTKDENKAISDITFNYLNLPKTMTVTGQGTINFKYTATGRKLEKAVYNTTTGTHKTAYAGKFVYAKQFDIGAIEPDYDLKLFKMSQGYVEPNAGGTIYSYIYQYKDNQGNIRASYTDSNNDGNIDIYRNGTDIDQDGDNINEIVQVSNYYPYGLNHEYAPGSAMSLINGFTNHPWKYNGQEFSKDLNINVTEMTFRQYDNALGRFHGVDALAGGTPGLSPYHFAANNPIMFTDPSGLKAMAQPLSTVGSSGPGWNPLIKEPHWTELLGLGGIYGSMVDEFYNGGGGGGGSASSGSNGGIGIGIAVIVGMNSDANGNIISNDSWTSIGGGFLTNGTHSVDLSDGYISNNSDWAPYENSTHLSEITVTGNSSGQMTTPLDAFHAELTASIYSTKWYNYLGPNNDASFGFSSALGGAFEMGGVAVNARSYIDLGADIRTASRTLDGVIKSPGNGQYYWRGSKYWTGNYIKGPNFSKVVSNTKYLKGAGSALTVVGGAVTLYQVGSEYSEGRYAAGTARAVVGTIQMAAVAFGPAGWAISAGIGIADAIWGDDFYNAIQDWADN